MSKHLKYLQENIRRSAHGMSNLALSKKSGVSEATISKILNLDDQNPSLDVIAKIADALELEPSDLIANPKKRPIPSDILDALESQPDSMYDFIRITLKTMAPGAAQKGRKL